MNKYNNILNKINRLIKKYGSAPKKYRLEELKQPNKLSIKKAEKIYTELSTINEKINRILREYPVKERPKIKRKISLYKKQTTKTVEEYADKLNVKKIKEEKNKKINKRTKKDDERELTKKHRRKQREKRDRGEYPDYGEIIINNFITNMRLIFSHNPPLLEYILGWLFTMIDNYGYNNVAIALDKAKNDGDWPDWEDISNESRVRGKLNRIAQVLEIPETEFEEILEDNESYEAV